MPLINCKVELSLTQIQHYTLVTSVNIANDTIAKAVKITFNIRDAKLYVPAVTLSKENNVELRKQLREGFKGKQCK